MKELAHKLDAIDRKSYKAYKQIQGLYQFPMFDLEFDHIQGDPFANPTRISIRLTTQDAGFSASLWSNPSRLLACEDFLARVVGRSCIQFARGNRGSGNSGKIEITRHSQQLLKRNTVLVSDDFIECRLAIGLPAAGRSVLAHEAKVMLLEELPNIVTHALLAQNTDLDAMALHINCNEDQDYLRHWLKQQKLVSFIADGSCLPRASGVDDQPLPETPHLFISPASLRYTVNLPHYGNVSGMGIPEGVNLIVGGGFHGKSTLLHAIELGVYNHIPGDGRERVATQANAIKIRAEDGRQIHNVNISPFIDNLPFGKTTNSFSSENASGSTSQAANIMEALECGCSALLIDEDTSATNFMIRDERMQQLVANDKEPITPLLHRVRELYSTLGISSIMVMGGSGDYLDVADTVIMMDAYQPLDVTQEAGKLKRSVKHTDSEKNAINPGNRTVERKLLNASRGKYDYKADVPEPGLLKYGEHRIDLRRVEQLLDPAQCRSIALILFRYYETATGNETSTIEGIREIMRQIETHGLDHISLYKVGDLALPRLYEVMAAINRVRKLH